MNIKPNSSRLHLSQVLLRLSALVFNPSAIAWKLNLKFPCTNHLTRYASGPLNASIVSYFVLPSSSTVSHCQRSVRSSHFGMRFFQATRCVAASKYVTYNRTVLANLRGSMDGGRCVLRYRFEPTEAFCSASGLLFPSTTTWLRLRYEVSERQCATGSGTHVHERVPIRNRAIV